MWVEAIRACPRCLRAGTAIRQGDVTSGEPRCNEPLPDGGMIRKLWIGETDAYRDHLLRLDHESRNRRFSGAVSDDFIARHAASANGLGVVVHGFFVDGVLRGAAELRALGSVSRARERPPSASSSPGKATASAPVARTHAPECAQPRHQVICRCIASPKINACSSSPANSRPISSSISAAWWARSISRARRRFRWCAKRWPMRTASRPQFFEVQSKLLDPA